MLPLGRPVHLRHVGQTQGHGLAVHRHSLDALGLGAIARQVEQAGVAQAIDRLGLDGMLALWQPAGTN